MSETIEERARKAAEAAFPKRLELGASAPAITEFQRRRDSYRLGFKAGHAASTRAAVIAELEALVSEAIIDDEAMHVRARAERRIAQLRAEREALP